MGEERVALRVQTVHVAQLAIVQLICKKVATELANCDPDCSKL